MNNYDSWWPKQLRTFILLSSQFRKNDLLWPPSGKGQKMTGGNQSLISGVSEKKSRGAPSFCSTFSQWAPDVLIYTHATWSWEIICFILSGFAEYNGELRLWVSLPCHISDSFSIAYLSVSFSCILSMIIAVECMLLLLLSVIVVLGEPLVIFLERQM